MNVVDYGSMMNNQNAALTEQESAWINEVAGRLRLIQCDAATAPPEQRREFLAEELVRHFKKAPPPDRRRYQEALLARFPVAGEVLGAAVPAPNPVAAPPAPRPETFDELFERFLDAAAALDETARASTVKRLCEAGLGGKSAGGESLEVSAELAKLLGLPAGQSPKPQNLIKLSAVLVDYFQRLDTTALATLRELAPRSSLLKRPQDFRAAAATAVIGEVEQIDPHLRAATALLGALLAAMLGGGRDFGRHFVERLSPGAIEDVVVGEGGGGSLLGIGKSKKERCWERYMLLYKDFETADLVERRLRDCMAAFVEKKILSAR